MNERKREVVLVKTHEKKIQREKEGRDGRWRERERERERERREKGGGKKLF